MLLLILVAVALGTGFTTYNITKNALSHEQLAAAPYVKTNSEGYPSTLSRESSQTPDLGEQSFQHYLVLLEGSNINVYISHNGHREFLYSRGVYLSDLSQKDIATLREGVMLGTASELTGFMENFTS